MYARFDTARKNESPGSQHYCFVATCGMCAVSMREIYHRFEHALPAQAVTFAPTVKTLAGSEPHYTTTAQLQTTFFRSLPVCKWVASVVDQKQPGDRSILEWSGFWMNHICVFVNDYPHAYEQRKAFFDGLMEFHYDIWYHRVHCGTDEAAITTGVSDIIDWHLEHMFRSLPKTFESDVSSATASDVVHVPVKLYVSESGHVEFGEKYGARLPAKERKSCVASQPLVMDPSPLGATADLIQSPSSFPSRMTKPGADWRQVVDDVSGSDGNKQYFVPLRFLADQQQRLSASLDAVAADASVAESHPSDVKCGGQEPHPRQLPEVTKESKRCPAPSSLSSMGTATCDTNGLSSAQAAAAAAPTSSPEIKAPVARLKSRPFHVRPASSKLDLLQILELGRACGLEAYSENNINTWFRDDPLLFWVAEEDDVQEDQKLSTSSPMTDQDASLMASPRMIGFAMATTNAVMTNQFMHGKAWLHDPEHGNSKTSSSADGAAAGAGASAAPALTSTSAPTAVGVWKKRSMFKIESKTSAMARQQETVRNDSAFVLATAVLPSERRRGVGKVLMKALHESIMDNCAGINRVTLLVRQADKIDPTALEKCSDTLAVCSSTCASPVTLAASESKSSTRVALDQEFEASVRAAHTFFTKLGYAPRAPLNGVRGKYYPDGSNAVEYEFSLKHDFVRDRLGLILSAYEQRVKMDHYLAQLQKSSVKTEAPAMSASATPATA